MSGLSVDCRHLYLRLIDSVVVPELTRSVIIILLGGSGFSGLAVVQ